MVNRLKFTEAEFQKRIELLVESRCVLDKDIDELVYDILNSVRTNGDEAIIGFTKKFDRLNLSGPADIRISEKEIETALANCSKKTLSALKHAANRIEAYHKKQLPEDFDFIDSDGVRLGSIWTPITSVGLYVPGGTAAYPSSVLMNAIPARVAGVQRLVMVVPTPDGYLNSSVLAAASIAGIDEIYRIGGAQAVGALAYGTKIIKPVDKIVGPGNAYVASAKRQVFGFVGIDMIAGPSEILVVADKDTNPSWVASDLLSQAEHDVDAQSILICDDEVFATAVEEALNLQLKNLPREKIARKSWEQNGTVIIVESLSDAADIINKLAPEHLELAINDPEQVMNDVSNAGAIFLGRYTPEAIGDYIGGPSHVLPTSGNARFESGLGVLDFLKRTSIIGCDEASLSKVSESAEILANEEGLHGHALSISLRHSES
ncbi:MAG: histidinol dehydrogenase [Pseudomonadota bacterium]|nr:histidinol dehydrogenase [Pseudomonadota bacterium]